MKNILSFAILVIAISFFSAKSLACDDLVSHKKIQSTKTAKISRKHLHQKNPNLNKELSKEMDTSGALNQQVEEDDDVIVDIGSVVPESM